MKLPTKRTYIPAFCLLSACLFIGRTEAQSADYTTTIDNDVAANHQAYQVILNQSVNLLCQAPRVEGAVIYGGQTRSLFATAFNWVEGDRDQRRKLFEKIFVDAETRSGKLYALLGIFQEDPLEFEALSHRMDPREKVVVIDGSASTEVEVGTVLQSIRDRSLLVSIGAPNIEPNPAPKAVSNSGTD